MTSKLPLARTGLPTLAMLVVLALSGSAQAATSYYWVGDNANSTAWNVATGAGGTNWSTAPDVNTDPRFAANPNFSAIDVFFVFNTPISISNITLGQNFTINSLNFTSTSTSPIIIGGANTLTINSTGTGLTGLTVNSGAAAHTLATPVLLGANETWTNNSTSAFTASGIIQGTGINLTLAGGGGFVFSNANTYSGTTSLINSGTALTLNGANGSLATTAISLDGGTTLTMDNTAAVNTNRILDTTGITSRGATIALLGTSCTETVGTLALSTGTTLLNPAGGCTLVIGGSGITRSTGGTVNFTTTGTVNVPTATNSNNMIGGYATIGNVGVVQQDAIGSGNMLDFASVNGSFNIVTLPSFSPYTLNSFTTPTANVQVTTANSLTSGATVNVNSLYLTGAGAVTLTGNANLVIGSGGIICNAATGSEGGAGPQITLTNCADLGSGVFSGASTGGGAITGTVTAGTNAALNNDLVVTTASNLRMDCTITNNGTTVVNLVKNGSGTLDLSDGNNLVATNTYSGITTINGGLVTIKSDRNFGAVPASNTPNSITMNGGEFRMTATITIAPQRGITVGPQGGTISYNGGNTTLLTGYLVTGSGSVQYSCIPGFGNVSNNQCAIDVGFATTNYQGGTTFFTQGSTSTNAIAAVIYFGGNNLVPATSAVTVNTVAGSGGSKGILNLFGTTQSFGSLAGNSDILNGVATTSPLTVGGNNLSTTYTGSLGRVGATWAVGANNHTGADNTGGSTAAITLTKVGTGTLTMSGANGYTGATTINGGTMLIGTGTTQTGAGSLAVTPVTVNTATLGGNGTIGGTVSVSATGHIAPAMSPTSTATLTINNNVTMANGATLDYNFGTAGTPGTSDKLVIGTTKTITFALGATYNVNINQLSGFGIGTYVLVDATAASSSIVLSGTGATPVFTPNGSSNFTYAVAIVGNQVILTVTAGLPTLFWTGNASTAWIAGGPLNWFDGSSAKSWSTNFNAVFDDSNNNGSNFTVATDAGGISPNSILFANGTGTYNINGPGFDCSGRNREGHGGGSGEHQHGTDHAGHLGQRRHIQRWQRSHLQFNRIGGSDQFRHGVYRQWHTEYSGVQRQHRNKLDGVHHWRFGRVHCIDHPWHGHRRI